MEGKTAVAIRGWIWSRVVCLLGFLGRILGGMDQTVDFKSSV